MRTNNQVLISFFESEREADEALALSASGNSRGRRTPAVVVSRSADTSRSAIEPPAVAPFGTVIGTALGGVLGSLTGETGAVVVGLFFGLYVGLFADLWRRLSRGDLLDEVQDGLAAGQAALVTFVGRSSARKIGRRLAATQAVTVHRFAGTPVEDDFAREVREAAAALDRLADTDGAMQSAPGDRDRAIAMARRKLSMLEAIGNRLLWLERLQFGFETGILNRELKESPRWRAPRLRSRVTHVRASHQRARAKLETSSVRVRAAQAMVAATGVARATDPAL